MYAPLTIHLMKLKNQSFDEDYHNPLTKTSKALKVPSTRTWIAMHIGSPFSSTEVGAKHRPQGHISVGTEQVLSFLRDDDSERDGTDDDG